MTVEHVIKLLLLANNDIQSIERICQGLKREEADLTAKNLNAASAFHQLSNDISEESKIVDQYRTSCKKERLELDKLRLQKIGLESMIRQFQNNNECFQMIKDLVRQTVGHSLMSHRQVLTLALLSVIDSCRRDPMKFNILYHNLSADIITREIRLAEVGMIDQNNYALSTNEQLCYQHENDYDDVAYCKILIKRQNNSSIR